MVEISTLVVRQCVTASLQQQISLENNEALIGTMQKVLIDSYDAKDNISYGRTFRDSPEIDNQVIIRGKLTPGIFHDLEITDAMEYDLFADLPTE